MNTKMNHAPGRIIGPAALIFGIMLGICANGQTIAAMSTNTSVITHNGEEAWRILQSGTETVTGQSGARFTFKRLDEINGGQFANENLASVKVTIRHIWDSAALTATNDSNADSWTGGVDSQSAISFSMPIYALGAETAVFNSSGTPVGGITSGDFLSASPILTLPLQSVTIDPLGQKTATTPGATTNKSQNVAADYWGDYDGTGTFNFDIRTLFSITSTALGNDITMSQTVGNSYFFTEVEYIIIPEPGTIGLMAIALGSAGAFAFLRRRKKA